MKLAYNLIKHEKGVPIKAFTKGVLMDDKAKSQLLNVSKLPFIHSHIAVMPDVHWGIGATVGSVIPSVKAIIPAAVGVDIGCGMCAVKTSLKASDLPNNLRHLRSCIEATIPVGSEEYDAPVNGALHSWRELHDKYKNFIINKYPKLHKGNEIRQLGTLGSGNHFLEMCLDEQEFVWLMLHSGSRGVGNRIGTFFIQLAKNDMRTHIKNLPDADLAYFEEGTEHFNDYVEAVEWAQLYAKLNREVMMNRFIDVLRDKKHKLPEFTLTEEAVNCHHNYVQREYHFGEHVYLTRKGAVSAKKGEKGIIPGSMGTKSYIVEGLGDPDSFHSCSHGAGRAYSRGDAKKKFTIDDHLKATEGVECRKDIDVIDETPKAYKDIDEVIEAQSSLVKVLHVLKQILCVKG
eukprot:TRINITY_DN64_c3_g2_i1.p1 TRINITY_DN64_c3_g2~~TRINITY_DN64_c3_g2_i1.p1  ORF type:complete len:402 (-),score=41.05 TRINITY_DN64_c3_g2_i1:140-1345(-)